MSFTTRCPACATTFRVVPDQLKLSDGWVRCGHCADVFDATRYLETWASPTTERSADTTGASAAARSTGSDAEDQNQNPVSGEAIPPEQTQGPAVRAPAQAHAATPSAAQDVAPRDSPFAQSIGNEGTDDVSPRVADDAETVPMPLDDGGEEPADPNALSTSIKPEPPQSAPQTAGAWFQVSPDPVPASDSRDDFDRWLDRTLDEVESEPHAAPVPTAEADPLVPAAPATETEDFHAELRRYADKLKQASVNGSDDPQAAAAAITPATSAPAPLPTPSQGLDKNKHHSSHPHAQADEDEPADEAAWAASGDEPEFVRQARRRAFWHSPAMRVIMLLGALVLGVLLLGQWALHERDRLAARRPDLAPTLALLCQPFGCRLEPVRRIEAIEIDSSTLVRRLGNFYSFDLVLKNTSPLALAVPALELSLTDTTDQVISRRVFLPEELPGVPALLPAQGSVPVSLRLSLAVGDQLPMTGYRALVFYP